LTLKKRERKGIGDPFGVLINIFFDALKMALQFHISPNMP